MIGRPLVAMPLGVALVVGSCTAIDVPTGGGLPALVAPRLQVIPSASDAGALPINRIRAVVSAVSDGATLDEIVSEVDPSAAAWTVELAVPGPEAVEVYVYVYLINVSSAGDEDVQFSGRTDPISLVVGRAITPDVPIVRGPLANLFVTGVSITDAPADMTIGETATLAGEATTSGADAPTIFWTALDETVVAVDGPQATAVAAGTARIVASAGAFADTVSVDVVSADTDAPGIVSYTPAPDAVGVSRSTVITATFDEPIDPATINATTFTLVDSLGVAVESTVSLSGLVATLDPVAPLDSLHRYTASLTPGVTDLAGNGLGDPFAWGFTTAGSAEVLSMFDAGLGLLVSVAFDPVAGTLFLQPDFDPSIVEVSTAGVELARIPSPGPSSNDIDLDFADVPTTIGATAVPENSLLVVNGEFNPGKLYAVNRDDGEALDSLVVPVSGNPVGGALRPDGAAFYSVDWTADVITEIDLATGEVASSFPVQPTGSPAFDVFYGDIDVNPLTGSIIVVSSSQNTIRLLSPAGVFIEDIDLTGTGISGMSGIAWDAVSGTAWISTTTGLVYRVSGIE